MVLTHQCCPPVTRESRTAATMSKSDLTSLERQEASAEELSDHTSANIRHPKSSGNQLKKQPELGEVAGRGASHIKSQHAALMRCQRFDMPGPRLWKKPVSVVLTHVTQLLMLAITVPKFGTVTSLTANVRSQRLMTWLEQSSLDAWMVPQFLWLFTCVC
jgi:hypothetical protein